LARLHHEPHGELSFANLDGHLAFDAKGDGSTLEGEASQNAGSGTSLAFRLHFDQTEIQAILSSLDKALRAFRILGSPNSLVVCHKFDLVRYHT
jgi:hypothetical protein